MIYSNEQFLREIKGLYPDIYWLKGGRGKAGIKVLKKFYTYTSFRSIHHIICAVGTGTMMTGIINSSFLPEQE